MVRADRPDSPSDIRTTERSPRWSARNSKTSAETTATGALSTTVKNAFRAWATAGNVFGLVRPATNSR